MARDSNGQGSAKFLGPEELCKLWENHHGSLSEAHKELFLLRPEIPWLTCIPEAHVGPAFAKATKLQRILLFATQSFEKDKAKVRADTEAKLDSSRTEAEHFTVKKPKNPSRMRLS